MKIIGNDFGLIGKEKRSYLRFYLAKNVPEYYPYFLAHIDTWKFSITILAELVKRYDHISGSIQPKTLPNFYFTF